MHDLTPLPPVRHEVSKWDLRPRPPSRPAEATVGSTSEHVPANKWTALPGSPAQPGLGDGLRRSRARVAPERAEDGMPGIKTDAAERKSGKVFAKLGLADWFEAQLAVQAAAGAHHKPDKPSPCNPHAYTHCP